MLKIAFQMEPLEETKREKTDSLALMQEAQNRGHKLYHFEPKDVFVLGNQVLANAREANVNLEQEDFYSYGNNCTLNLRDDIDVLHIRQDPPFDMNYITNTYILDMITEDTLVVNNPSLIRNFAEKIYPFEFSEYMPPTLVASSFEELVKFQAEHGEIIVKPLYEFSGYGIEKISSKDELTEEKISSIKKRSGEYFMAQKYLSEVTKTGDKRVFFVDGDMQGVFARMPEKGSFLANTVQGGKIVDTKLTKREKEICDKVGKSLKEKGIILCGIDLIGECLTEINITSPAGINFSKNLYNINFADKIWDVIESKLRSPT